MLPRVKETTVLVNERLINWTIVPCPTRGWAERVHPELAPDAAVARLWQQIGHICRLDEPDPIAAWRTRMDHLLAVSTRLNELELDQLLYSGPGTELAIGLLPGAHWQSAELTTAEGITHVPNIPTEEVFTTPDPERVEGVVRATKPLYTAGALITGLRVRFEGGEAIAIEADEGAAALQALSERDAGAVRLGEVALVDRDSRIGRLDTVFYDTLLDENAASHIALGHGFLFTVDDTVKARVNESEIHIDFMIGSNDLKVTGVTPAGREVPLLRDGAWQI
jgi:aminopeptidase